MNTTVTCQHRDFTTPLSIPRKLSESQSPQTRSNIDPLFARGHTLLFATPSMDDKYFTSGRRGDVHKRIVVQATKLHRARRSSQWLLHQRVRKSLRCVKYQQPLPTRSADAHGNIRESISRTELSGAQCSHRSR